MRTAAVLRIPAAAPDDMSGIEAAITGGRLDPRGIVAILGKTEGNGCVNDFTRGYAALALGLMLRRHLDEDAAAAVCLVMSGGTEGALAPHWTVFARSPAGPASAPSPALAVGRAHTPALPPEELGRAGQVRMVAAAVRAAMADAAIDDPAEVHFVQVKCPLLTAARIGAAEARGATVATRDALRSMGLSRAASALGVAAALGEIAPERAEAGVGDPALWSARASASAGVELDGHEVVVIGMSPHWAGPLAVDHAVMADAIDVEPVRAALVRLGLDAPGQLPPAARGRLVAVLAKVEASPDGRLRGHRHTMLDDSDLSATRHARAFVAGALAGIVGHAEIYVSGGAEHQGPPGGGPVALVVARKG
jgi:cyanuric acid amidohydrolase